ncbi:hypothetical protein EJF36_16460 [Bacillus sp. HMF5848]|nr:hypothetical protein EJF36_16460 [Bacillus sp. HMF5848]
MTTDELINKINSCVEALDFVSARKYIEENISIVESNKYLLKRNARDILKFLTQQIESGYQTLSRKELATLNAINTYAYNFDLRGIKNIVKNESTLLIRSDIESYLNSDAVTILAGMGAIRKALN